MYLLQVFKSRLKFRPSAKRQRSKTTLHALPNELLLEIFSFLPLRSYILGHAVCKKWNQLLPLTILDPIRERFLDLYHLILRTPNFEQAFEWTERNLQPFDREEYIQTLLSQYPGIPEEFRMWILEWPARLAMQCMWPGLPLTNCNEYDFMISRRAGVNWIAYSPHLSALIYKHNTPSETLVPALLLWRCATQVDWLCFAQDEPDLFGQVMRFDAADYHLDSMPYSPPLQDNESDLSDLTVFQDWIDYLEFMWADTEMMLKDQRKIFKARDISICRPIRYSHDSPNPSFLPAPVWNSSGPP